MANKLRDDEIKWILSLDAKGVQSQLVGLSSKSKELTDENKKLGTELKAVEKDMDRLQKQMAKMSADGDTASKSYIRLKNAFEQVADDANDLRKQIDANNKSINENNRKASELIQTMRIEDMTMDQLSRRAKELESQLRNTSLAADPAAYEALEAELERVNLRMAELDEGGEQVASTFTGKVGKAIVAVTAAIITAQQAFRLFEDIMLSNRATGIEFQGMMDGLANSISYVKTSIANLDFSNFMDNLKNAYKVGYNVSLQLEELYDKENSFKITSIKDRAEIEELKTDLRDVNLTAAQRIEIADKIIEKTKALADQEKKLNENRLDAAKKILMSQTDMTEAELEYAVLNRNTHEQDINNINKIKDLEEDLIELRKNRDTYEQYSDNGPKTKKNGYYLKLYEETQQEVEEYEKLIGRLKEKYGFLDEEQYTLATNALEKYMKVNKEAVDAYVNSRMRVEEVDVKTLKELRQTERLKSTIIKSERAGAETAANKAVQELKKAQDKMLEKLETKHQEELVKLKEKYKTGEIKSEAELNRKIYSQEQAYYALREETLEGFIASTKNADLRSSREKELSQLRNKQIDDELKFRKELEKIILDANPEAKERVAYEERLQAVGLFDAAMLREKEESGEAIEKLTEEQLQALLQLETQYQKNIRDIRLREDKRRKADAEKAFEESFKDERRRLQEELAMKEQETAFQVGAGSLTGDAAFKAELEVHKLRLEMLRKEIDARTEAGLEADKLNKELARRELDLTKTYVKEFNRRMQAATKYGQDLGTVTGNVIAGQQDMLEGFSGVLLDIVFDTLTQYINAQIIRTTAAATAAISETTSKQIASKGFAGIGTSAILAGVITGAMTAAKTALKGLIGKRKATDSSSGSTGTGQRVVSSGYADGGYHQGYTGDGSKYEVKGVFPDGQPYHAGEYIVPSEVMRNPVAVPMIRKIEALRRNVSTRNPLPEGFADGGYHTGEDISGENAIIPVLSKLIDVMQEVRDKPLELNYYTFEDAKKIVDKARDGAKKR